jgi:hypothetical protein
VVADGELEPVAEFAAVSVLVACAALDVLSAGGVLEVASELAVAGDGAAEVALWLLGGGCRR